MGKVKVALFLEPGVAKELKVQAALAGLRGLSAYVAQLVRRAAQQRKSV